MKNIFRLLFAILLPSSVAFSQSVHNGKIQTYEIFYSKRMILEEVLTQQNCNKKSLSCVITVIDSTYYKQPKVKPMAVKESIAATFNSQGQPIQLDYSFKSNIISYDKLVTYSYTPNSVFVKSGFPPLDSKYTTMIPNPIEEFQYYLYTRNSDGLHESKTFWYSCSDTNGTARSCEWITKSKNRFDSIRKYEDYGLLASHGARDIKPISEGVDSLIAFQTQGSTTTCTYHSSIDNQPGEKTYRYTFNQSGKMTLSEILNGDVTTGWTRWDYDEQNRLTLYETTTYGKGLTKVQITRNTYGQPVLMKWQSNTENLTFKFVWK